MNCNNSCRNTSGSPAPCALTTRALQSPTVASTTTATTPAILLLMTDLLCVRETPLSGVRGAGTHPSGFIGRHARPPPGPRIYQARSRCSPSSSPSSAGDPPAKALDGQLSVGVPQGSGFSIGFLFLASSKIGRARWTGASSFGPRQQNGQLLTVSDRRLRTPGSCGASSSATDGAACGGPWPRSAGSARG